MAIELSTEKEQEQKTWFKKFLKVIMPVTVREDWFFVYGLVAGASLGVHAWWYGKALFLMIVGS